MTQPGSLPPVSVFGKTPGMGDFLRVGSAGRAGEAFEEWLDRGIAMAEGKRGAAWAPTFSAGAPWAFVFRAPRSAGIREGLVGVLKPSVDSVGRLFPLVVLSPALPTCVAPWPHVLPMAFGDFLDGAASALMGSAAVTSVADMAGILRGVPAPFAGDAAPVAQEYAAWAASTPLQNAWAAIYGGDRTLSAPYAIHTLFEAIAPFRGEVGPTTKLGLRLPLGGGGVAAAAFWIDMVRQFARSLAEVRSCFWSFDGRTGSMIIQLGDTPASTLGELWAPDPDNEHLCDLTAPATVEAGRFLARLPPHVAETLMAPQALAGDFLARLVF
jgi:type VI secretion system protein ImpM